MLSGKVVVITGGSRGIGQAVALACAREGMRVAVCARSSEELEDTRALVARETREELLTGTADVAEARSVGEFVARTERELGPAYALVCAAGILGAIGPIDETPFEQWEQSIRVNLFGTVHAIRAVLAGMKGRGAGRIVLFSGGGQGPLPRRTSYAASKGALWRLTESLGHELAPSGVYVNAIAPGAVNTQFLADVLAAGPERAGLDAYDDALEQERAGGAPAQRAADLAMYLLSDASAGLYAKIISAIWDDYRDWRDLGKISKSDRYTMKRVVSPDGRTRG